MNINHVKAVFKAEYFTTTSKFRNIRKWIPLLFVLGVFIFSFVLRVIFNFFRGDLQINNPPVDIFYSIIAVFTYFILFAPLLSPLGRVVYDGEAKSRREVALNSPVASKDLLYGNLLSNLVFFLPFFAFIGTLVLAPFTINGLYNPFITAILLFGVLSLLILIGLIAGTIITPVIYNTVASQQSARSRALVTIGVSFMLVLSLPLLRYFLENIDAGATGMPILYLPFTLAASLIVYILQGVVIGPSPLMTVIILLLYLVLIYMLGYFSADTIYNFDNDESLIIESEPSSLLSKIVNFSTSLLPSRFRFSTRSILKASLRDIEHMARLTIGIAISIFMIFALSSRGLFRNTAGFNQDIELAVVVFALILSSASVIFIETASFTVQHRDMFALIKSAPLGVPKFIVSKVLQMYYIIIPVFIVMITILTQMSFISKSNFLLTIYFLFLSISSMVTISLAIYLVNATDNQEDLSNFINLLVFYVFAFIQALIPVAIILIRQKFRFSDYLIATMFAIFIILLSIRVSINSLEKMDLETLSSTYTSSIRHGFITAIVFITGVSLIPFVPLLVLAKLEGTSLTHFIILNNLLMLVLPIIYYFYKKAKIKILFNLKLSDAIQSLKFLAVMLLIGISIQGLYFMLYPNHRTPLLIEFTLFELILVLVAGVITEEIFFRGFLYDFAKMRMNEREAIVLSSLFFGLLHILNVASFVNAVIQGILLLKLRLRTSLTSTILVHLLYNAFVISVFGL